MREDEQSELEEHRDETCVLPVRGGVENSYGKVNILLQVYISREAVDSFSLTSDLAYVAQVRGMGERGSGWEELVFLTSLSFFTL